MTVSRANSIEKLMRKLFVFCAYAILELMRKAGTDREKKENWYLCGTYRRYQVQRKNRSCI